MKIEIHYKNDGLTQHLGRIERCSALGKNGVMATVGLLIQSGGADSMTRLTPINSRGQLTRCWIDIPAEPTTIREIASHLLAVAAAIERSSRQPQDAPRAYATFGKREGI